MVKIKINKFGAPDVVFKNVIDNNLNYVLTNVEGLESQPLIIGSSPVVGGDGVYVNSKRLDYRQIVLEVTVLRDVPAFKRQILTSLQSKPAEVSVGLEINGRPYSIDGIIENISYPQMSTSPGYKVSIPILCPDPWIKKPKKVETRAIENMYANYHINNNGDAAVGFTVEVETTGYIPYLHVSDGVDTIQCSPGSDVQAGDKIRVSTMRGEKGIWRIRNSSTISLMGTSMGSTFFDLERGQNSIEVKVPFGAEEATLTYAEVVGGV